MPQFTLTIENLRALRAFHWTPPPGVSVVVGPNGAGKTTLLLTLKFLRAALERTPAEAMSIAFRGTGNLLNVEAGPEEEIAFGLDLGDLSWRLAFSQVASHMEGTMREILKRGDEVIFAKDNLGFSHRGQPLPPLREMLGLKALTQPGDPDPAAESLASFLRALTVFFDADLVGLRKDGSKDSMNRHLSSHGENSFAMLHKWLGSRDDRERYQFVVDGMKASFPQVFQDLDFERAGETVYIRVFRPGMEQPLPIRDEANGLLSMLVLLCDVAAAEPGGVVAIDEPENALHPFAIREFLRRAGQWARQHDLTVVLTTHSPVVLNHFTQEPSRIHVLRAKDPSMPVRLDEIKNPEWLARFCLGELYENCEFGADDGEV